MDKVLLWLQEKTMDSIPKRMEVQVQENLPEQEDFYHTLRYFGVFRDFFYQVTQLLQLVFTLPRNELLFQLFGGHYGFHIK